MQKQNCLKLKEKLTDLLKSKADFDIAVEELSIASDKEVVQHIMTSEETIKQIISDVEKIVGDGFESESLDMLEKAAKKSFLGFKKNNLAQSLVGFDSDRAWEIRDSLINSAGVKNKYILIGLAGCNSERAWAIRDDAFERRENMGELLASLAGIDSDRAWDMRGKLSAGFQTVSSGIISSLLGIDSDRAWDFRFKAIEKANGPGVVYNVIAEGLAGLDSDKAWDLRGKLLADKVSLDSLLVGLAGCDSGEAWQIRNSIGHRRDIQYLSTSIAGLDSDEAWKLRKWMEDTDVSPNYIVESLTGIDSEKAWTMRERFLKKGATEISVMMGINGDYKTSPRIICKHQK